MQTSRHVTVLMLADLCRSRLAGLPENEARAKEGACRPQDAHD